MSEMDWKALREECLDCRRCGLASTRTHVVFGVGSTDAEIMLIGEGPGANEDLQGEPFVGRGGQLLDKMLAAVGLSREKNVYIANIVKCRPPQNRDPLPEEQEACIGWLPADLAGIQGHPGARAVYRKKRRVDDGHPSPRRRAAGPRQKTGMV